MYYKINHTKLLQWKFDLLQKNKDSQHYLWRSKPENGDESATGKPRSEIWLASYIVTLTNQKRLNKQWKKS